MISILDFLTKIFFRELELNNQEAATPLAPGACDDTEEHPMEIGEMRQVPSNELSFQLEPIEQQPHHERMRHKRKRKLIIDEQKTLTGEEMKANMADYRYFYWNYLVKI